MDSMYLDNLDEYVNDEGKIVTYKWLSLTLGVHTNTAKRMLYHFVEKQRKEDKSDLNVTYFVSGIEPGKEGCPDVHKMMVVPEENLAAAKSKLKEVSSVHVYSVQKAKLTDLSLLYTANYDTVKEHILDINKYSGIVCPDAMLHSSADLEKLQKGNAYQPPAEPSRPESKYKKREPEEGDKKPAQINSKNFNNKAKGGQIALMFAQQVKKTEMKEKTEDTKEDMVVKESKSSSKPANKTKPGISVFFNKGPAIQDDGKTQAPSSPANSRTSPRKAATAEQTEVKIKEEIKENEKEVKMETDSPVKKSPVKKSPVKKSPVKKAKRQAKITANKGPQQRGKNKRKVEEEEAPKTKRKRILQVSDSESCSDEEDDAEAADRATRSPTPPPPSPTPPLNTARIESDSEEEVVPPTPQDCRPGGERRVHRKKWVDKTYIDDDDDGFITTKKEYVCVEDSVEEDTADTTTTTTTSDTSPATSQSPSATATRRSPRKALSLPQKNTKDSPKKKGTKASKKSHDNKKQSTLMSYFNKK